MFIPLADRNPLQIISFQWVTVSLIAINVAVFVFFNLRLGDNAEQAAMIGYGVIPAVLFDSRELPPELVRVPEELTLISYQFFHGDWMHLIANMAFLWVFGDNVEDSMGHWRFLLFYCVCGAFASLAHALAQSDSISPLIGASGAVAGVLGAYLVLHPRVKVIVFVLMRVPLRLRAYWVLGFWVALQLFYVVSGSSGNTAWWAHIGGFVMGAILIPFFKLDSVPLFDRGTEH